MELRIRIANPAGNITIFVMDMLERSQYAKVANQLMAIKEYKAEQVGFVTPPKAGGVSRLEMMGGEFCGNATRSFGYLLSELDENKPEKIKVEISGANECLEVEIDHEAGTCSTQMPLPQGIEQLSVPGWGTYDMVLFDGVIHVIVPKIPATQKIAEDILKAVQKVKACDAYGVMFLEPTGMTPVVLVKATNSLIWESSCGSGSMACAVYMAREKQEGYANYRFKQPGGTIEATVVKKAGEVVECRMGGSVSLSEEVKVMIK